MNRASVARSIKPNGKKKKAPPRRAHKRPVKTKAQPKTY